MGCGGSKHDAKEGGCFADLAPGDVRAMFDDADKDKSGQLSVAEFVAFYGDAKYKTMFKSVQFQDKNKDMRLNFDEFLEAVWLKPLFGEADKGRWEHVSPTELDAYFMQTGLGKMKAILESKMDEATCDRKISFEEFKTLMLSQKALPEAYFLPMEVNGKQILQRQAEGRWLVRSSEAEHTGPGVVYRYEKDMSKKHPNTVFAKWDTVVDASDEGEGWVRVNLKQEADVVDKADMAAPVEKKEGEPVEQFEGVKGGEENTMAPTLASAEELDEPARTEPTEHAQPSGGLFASCHCF